LRTFLWRRKDGWLKYIKWPGRQVRAEEPRVWNSGWPGKFPTLVRLLAYCSLVLFSLHKLYFSMLLTRIIISVVGENLPAHSLLKFYLVKKLRWQKNSYLFIWHLSKSLQQFPLYRTRNVLAVWKIPLLSVQGESHSRIQNHIGQINFSTYVLNN